MLCRDAFVTVMQTAEHRSSNQPGRPDEDRQFGRRKGRIAVKPLMRPVGVIIGVDEFVEHALQMGLIENDNVVEQLAAHGSDEAFDVGVLPRAMVSAAYFFDAATV